LTSSLDEGGWSASCPSRFTPGYPLDRRQSVPRTGLDVVARNRTPAIQPVAIPTELSRLQVPWYTIGPNSWRTSTFHPHMIYTMETQTGGKVTEQAARGSQTVRRPTMIGWAHTRNHINESVRTEFSEECQIIGYRKGRDHYTKQAS
jgi:hypothetical protein